MSGRGQNLGFGAAVLRLPVRLPVGGVPQARLPDGYSQIYRWYVFGPSGFWTTHIMVYNGHREISLVVAGR